MSVLQKRDKDHILRLGYILEVTYWDIHLMIPINCLLAFCQVLIHEYVMLFYSLTLKN